MSILNIKVSLSTEHQSNFVINFFSAVTTFAGTHQLVDFISLLSYDLWSSLEHPNWADHPAPLEKTGHNTNVASLINYWLEHEMPASKINLGVPLYGNSWTIQQSQSRMELPISANLGPTNKYTGVAGQIPYYEICSNVRDRGWKSFGNISINSSAIYAVSPVNMSTYIWVGYDDVDTVKMKSEYVRKNGLGGVAIWDLSQDDFLNKCGNGPYNLSTTISRTLGIHSSPPLQDTPSSSSLPQCQQYMSFPTFITVLLALSGCGRLV